jgi:hypothetical protein
MKKTTLAVSIIIAFLLIAMAGTLFVRFVNANPYMRDYVVPDSHTKPPLISVYSPENNIICSNVHLNVTVSLPQSSTASFTFLHGVYYEADWLQNRTYLYFSYGLSDEIRSDNPPERQYFAYSDVLTGVPEGNHTLVMYAFGGGWYPPQDMKQSGFFIEGNLTVFFTVDNTSPEISSISIKHETYYSTNLPLQFVVNEPLSKITYSLDGQPNIVTAGNATLTNLTYGSHSIAVFATDKAGNVGAVQNVYFTIKEFEPFPITLVAVSIVTVIVVVVGLIVYFRKHKRQAAYSASD